MKRAKIINEGAKYMCRSIGIIADKVYIGVSMSLSGRVIPHFYLFSLSRKLYRYKRIIQAQNQTEL